MQNIVFGSQHLYKSPCQKYGIMFMVITDHCYPDWGYLADFLQSTCFRIACMVEVWTSYGTGSIFCCSGWVSHLWFESGFGKFPIKILNFSIFPPQVKKNIFGSGKKLPGSKTDLPLIYCGSKVCPSWVRAHL